MLILTKNMAHIRAQLESVKDLTEVEHPQIHSPRVNDGLPSGSSNRFCCSLMGGLGKLVLHRTLLRLPYLHGEG